MVNFTIEQLKNAMKRPENIRNMSVIAHVDHGKSTLTDALLLKAGLISSKHAGSARKTDTMQLEKEKGITIKSTGVSMVFSQKDEEEKQPAQEYLVNLIDSPGHIDFSSEVTAALRVTDGALVVVDSVDGPMVQTETVLRQACAEKVKPALMINKVDRKILELVKSSEDIYQGFEEVIAKVNIVLTQYLPEDMQESSALEVVKGNVAFGSGYFGWGFTIETFAKIYAKKFKQDPEKMKQKLWGDNFFDAKNKIWRKDAETEDGRVLKRAFCEYILEPIIKLHQVVLKAPVDQIEKFVEALNIKLEPGITKKLQDKKLLKEIMSNWINAADNLVDMIVKHLPSPKEAMKYRTDLLYEGPLDDPVATAMRNCDPNGPMIMYISKMFPNQDGSRFFAFGRVFSGTLKTGQKVRVLGPNYVPGKKDDLHMKSVTQACITMVDKLENMTDVPTGCIAALLGLDQVIAKAGTLTDYENAFPIKNMKYSVYPVVRVAVKTKKGEDLPNLIEGLKKLSQFDQLVQCYQDEESGEHIIAASGELHIEICVHQLENEFAKCPIIVSNPVVSYRETILAKSQQVCLAKSANKLNRIFGSAEPLQSELTNEIEAGKVSINDEKQLTNKLVEEFQWHRDDVKKLWSFGPYENGANVLVDQTKQLPNLKEIKDSLLTAFQQITQKSVLTNEPLRGVRFNINDALIHTDPVHRGDSQIVPAAMRLFKAALLNSELRIQEPVFLAEIRVPFDHKNGVYQVLTKRRGELVEEELVPGSQMVVMKAYLPVAQSFGFAGNLREATQGTAQPSCVFDHWKTINGDPREPGTEAYNIVKEIRLRKKLDPEIPKFNDYCDKL